MEIVLLPCEISHKSLGFKLPFILADHGIFLIRKKPPPVRRFSLKAY